MLERAGMASDLQSGTQLGHYRIERVIGRGGMGVVYLARDLSLDRYVALKILSPELAENETFRDRFIRESRLGRPAVRRTGPDLGGATRNGVLSSAVPRPGRLRLSWPKRRG
jgi:serine/threonine protein kinase